MHNRHNERLPHNVRNKGETKWEIIEIIAKKEEHGEANCESEENAEMKKM